MLYNNYAASLRSVTFEEGLKDEILAYLSVYDANKKRRLWSRPAFFLGLLGVVLLCCLGRRRRRGA